MIGEDSSAIEKQVQIDEEELKNQVNRTKVNLLNSRVNETFEFLDKYRNFALIAKNYEEPLIEKNFSNVKRAERSHAELFQDYLTFLDEEKEIKFKNLYVCEKCGTVLSEIPSENCPSCQNPSNSYIEIHK
jgi:rubrerythrin